MLYLDAKINYYWFDVIYQVCFRKSLACQLTQRTGYRIPRTDESNSEKTFS